VTGARLLLIRRNPMAFSSYFPSQRLFNPILFYSFSTENDSFLFFYGFTFPAVKLVAGPFLAAILSSLYELFRVCLRPQQMTHSNNFIASKLN
jgi:hypothetical protein